MWGRSLRAPIEIIGVIRREDDSLACSSPSFQGNFGGEKCCLESNKTLFPCFSTFLASAKYTLDEKLCKQKNIQNDISNTIKES